LIADLDAYAEAKLSKPVHSTRQADRFPNALR
jgi:hypothetical protein